MDRYFIDDHCIPDKNAQAELASIYEEVSGKFKAGSLVKGTVVTKESGGIFLNINYKSDGYIPGYEFSEFEYGKLAVGDEVEVLIESLEDMDGNVVLSYQKAKSMKIWNEISQIADEGRPVSGRVTHKVKGGLNVDVGIPAFLPGSQIDVHRVTDFDQFVGQDVICKVIKINRKRGNIIISRRKYLEEERSEGRKKALDSLFEGQVIRGIVKNITSYGAFVDVGGIDGLLHITDMSWGRISHPSEMIKIGDEITVKILSFDKENEKISLGIKQLQNNPWANVDKDFPVGARVKGKISSITDYGLFVCVSDGVEGLVHISEISWTERVQDLCKRYHVGDEVDVVVSSVEKDERRMSLSIKRLDDDPWKAAFDKFKPSDNVKGIVSNVADFGLFVRIYPGVDGLVHVSDISWTEHVSHPGEKFKRGDEIEVVVLAVEEDKRRISLGIKQLHKDPWVAIEDVYQVGKLVTGTVSKVTSFGVFVKFDDGIEGLAHISELSNKEIPDVSKFLPVGSRETFRVVKSSAIDRKLGLSLKSAKEGENSSGTETSQGRSEHSYQGRSEHSYQDRSERSGGFQGGRGGAGQNRRDNNRGDRDKDRGDRDYSRNQQQQTSASTPIAKGSLQLALERAKQQESVNTDASEAPTKK